MALKRINTAQTANAGIKALVYGGAGAGKTYLVKTLPHDKTFILSAEAGLLSLSDVSIDGAAINTFDDMTEAYRFLTSSEEARKYRWLAIDSISEIAEQVLSHEKAKSKDPRQAYGALIDTMTGLVRAFRDLPGRSIYMSAKLERVRDEASGAMLYGPSMPGSKLGPAMPYFFDLVMAMRVHRDGETGIEERALQTARDAQYEAKDRSGKLDAWEAPNLGEIAEKILGKGYLNRAGEIPITPHDDSLSLTLDDATDEADTGDTGDTQPASKKKASRRKAKSASGDGDGEESNGANSNEANSNGANSSGANSSGAAR